MKRLIKRYKTGVALAALVVTGLSPNADAIIVWYESAGPWGPAGTPFGQGPVEFVFEGVADGTTYFPGFGGAGTTAGNAANVALGIAAMDTTPTASPSLFAIGSEDAFGVVSVVRIKDLNTNATIWSPAVKNQQLVGSFFGGTDFWAKQDTAGANTWITTAETGFRINLYEQIPTAPLPNLSTITPALRGAGGGGGDAATPGPADFDAWTYTSVGPPPTLALALSLRGVTGFLDPSGGTVTPFVTAADITGLRANTQVQSTILAATGAQGNTQGYLEVTDTISGSNGQFNSNGFDAIYNTAGGEMGGVFNTADVRFTFTQQTLPGANPWVTSIAGVADTTAIPEPSSVMAGIACILPVLGTVLGRRRKQAQA